MFMENNLYSEPTDYSSPENVKQDWVPRCLTFCNSGLPSLVLVSESLGYRQKGNRSKETRENTAQQKNKAYVGEVSLWSFDWL